MESWLQSLNYVRNLIAHHGRLWNSALVIRARPSSRGAIASFDILSPNPTLNTRIYFICCILAHLCCAANPQTTWPQRFKELALNFPAMTYANVGDMGFSDGWQNHDFWR